MAPPLLTDIAGEFVPALLALLGLALLQLGGIAVTATVGAAIGLRRGRRDGRGTLGLVLGLAAGLTVGALIFLGVPWVVLFLRG